MQVHIVQKKQLQRVGVLLLFGAAAALLLRYPAAVASGVSRGLAVCGEVIVPSLFPFLVLSGVFIHSGTAQRVGGRLHPIAQRIFGFSGGGATAWLIGMIGGYPSGAAAVRDLLERGEIDRKEAARLLLCCVNGGPAFIIGTVGARLLGSVYKGVLLYIAQVTAAVLMALFTRQRGGKRNENIPPLCDSSFSAAFSTSVERAVAALLSMGGFVLLFSTVLTLSDAVGITGVMSNNFTAKAVYAAVWEVSCGCVSIAACNLSGVSTAFLLGAALGWGGLSVSAQIRGMFSEHALQWGSYRMARLWQALLGGSLSALLFGVLPMPQASVPTAAPLFSPVAVQPFSVSAAASAALLLLCGGVMFCAARE